jgi:hypothetical protein
VVCAGDGESTATKAVAPKAMFWVEFKMALLHKPTICDQMRF